MAYFFTILFLVIILSLSIINKNNKNQEATSKSSQTTHNEQETNEKEDTTLMRSELSQKQLYEKDMKKYNSTKVWGIVFIFIFLPIGLIILLTNTKPDANAYRDWN